MRKVIFPILLLVFLSGCSLQFSRTPSNDGGVYLSVNKGDTWEQKVFVSQGEKADVTIGNVNIDRFVAWSPDVNLLYSVSSQSGVWVLIIRAGSGKGCLLTRRDH